MMNRARGIALIDLLVLVALISVLAAIFIPQFAAFAVRTQNAAAISDLRDAVAAEESLFADYGGYGVTQFVTGYPGPGGTGNGWELFGPVSPATATTAGGVLTMGPAVGLPPMPVVSIGISVSALVALRVDTFSYPEQPRQGYGASYLVTAKHRMGDTAFAAETEIKKTIYACRNTSFTWVGIGGLGMVTVPFVTTGTDLSMGPYNVVACGGMEIPNWTPLP